MCMGEAEVRDDHPPVLVKLIHLGVADIFELAGAGHGLTCSTLIHNPGLSP